MSWVSVEKFKTVCEAIKNYVISQADDAYNKAVTKMGDYVKKSGDTMTGSLIVDGSVNDNIIQVTENEQVTTVLSKSGLGCLDNDYYIFVSATNAHLSHKLDNPYNELIADFSPFGIEFQNIGEYEGKKEFNLKETDIYVETKSASLKNYDNINTDRFIQLRQRTHGELDGLYIALTDDFDLAVLTQYQDGERKNALGSEFLARILCGSPTLDYHATTKKYVDAAIAGVSPSGKYLPLSGGKLTGILDMQYHNITQLPEPANETSATNKKYVDDAVALKVNTSDEMTTTELNTILALFA